MICYPMLALSFPANASIVIGFLLSIANFDFPYVNAKTLFGAVGIWNLGENSSDLLQNIPNNDLLKNNLNGQGFDSKYFSEIMGSLFLAILLKTIGLILIPIMYICRNSSPKIAKMRLKLKKKLLWNFGILLVLEGLVPMLFGCYLNIAYSGLFPDAVDN